MAERERDDLPLDELRRAWRDLEPELPPEDLERSDATTRASIEWMRAAWSGLEVPEPRAPAHRPRRRLLARVAPYAAAAAVLAALWFAKSPRPVQRSAELARSESGVPIPPSDFEGPQLAALSSEHVELRSGPVRLILLKDRRTP